MNLSFSTHKPMLFSLLSVSACLFLSMPSFADSTQKTRTINVSGSSEIRVVPDQIVISMGVVNKDKNIQTAKKNNDNTVQSLIHYLTKKLKIPAKNIQTDFLSVSFSYYQCRNDEERAGLCDPLEIHYYHLSKGIQIRLDDLSQYEAVISKSLELGVNQVSNIQFVSTELRKHKDKARELATIAAKEKAEAVAGELGMRLNKPYSISLNDSGIVYPRFNNNMNAVLNRGESHAQGDSSLAVGQINVTATVTVHFDME